MIHLNTQLVVADNSGAKIVKCIKVLGSTGKKVATISQKIVVSIKDAIPQSKVSQGQVHYALIIRQKQRIRRKDGSYINFDDNAAIILDKKGEMIGTRVFGPVPREIKNAGYSKVASLASEIL